MRLQNRSHYDTRALRRVITTVHRVMARTEGRLPTWRYLRIRVETRRPRYTEGAVSGWATLDGGRMRLRLPHPKHGGLSAARFAWLVEHELYHSYGHRHGKFSTENAEWWKRHVGDGDLSVRQAKARRPRDLVAERAAKAARMLALWTRRMRRATRRVKVYERKVRYYREKSPTGVFSNPGRT